MKATGKFGLGCHLQFHKVVGAGSEGQTWLCYDLIHKERVAVKIIKRAKDSLHRSRKFNPQRVAGEIIIQSALSHPNIVQLKKVLLSPSHLAIVLEFASGGELYKYLKVHCIPERVLFPSRFKQGKSKKLAEGPDLLGVLSNLARSKRDHKDASGSEFCACKSSDFKLRKLPKKDDRYRKHLDEDRALYFFQQILSSVSYCHRHHIAHRDLKLTNVLIDISVRPPLLKLCDFGLSKHWFVPPEKPPASTDGININSSSSSKVAAGDGGELDSSLSDFEKVFTEVKGPPLFARCKTRVGSPLYVAREIISREFCKDGYDGTAIDVWSMGVMLFYMVRGKFPFPDYSGRGTMETLRRLPSNVKSELLTSDLSKSELSDELKDLLLRMLRFDVSKRIKIDDIFMHPWVKREISDRRIDSMFEDLYSSDPKRKVSSGRSSGKFWRAEFWQTLFGPARKDRSSRGSGSKSSPGRMNGIGGDASKPEDNESVVPTRRVPTGFNAENSQKVDRDPSGFRFPGDQWLELKALVDEAAASVGSPEDPVAMWMPPFGPFRLTFDKSNVSAIDTNSSVAFSTGKIEVE